MQQSSQAGLQPSQEKLNSENCQNRRLKALEFNFIPTEESIAFLYFEDICSRFVELCLQDAQIALLHFTRLFTPTAAPPPPPLLLAGM